MAEKKWKCLDCNKGFKELSHLRSHCNAKNHRLVENMSTAPGRPMTPPVKPTQSTHHIPHPTSPPRLSVPTGIQCYKCPVWVPHHADLVQHLTYRHRVKDVVDIVQCITCNRTFSIKLKYDPETSNTEQYRIRRCDCGMMVSDLDRWTHLNGRQHRVALQTATAAQSACGAFDQKRCDACLRASTTQAKHNGQQRTAAHRDAVVRAAAPATAATTGFSATLAASGHLRCNVCRQDVHADVWFAHSARHTIHQQRAAVSAAIAEGEQDKNGVMVTCKDGVDFGIIDPSEVALHPGTPRSLDVRVAKTDVSSVILLYAIRLTPPPREAHYTMNFSAALRGPGRAIRSGSPRTVSVMFHPKYEGQYEGTMELKLRRLSFGSSTSEDFVITRSIRAIVGSPEDHKRLGPAAPYAWVPRTPRTDVKRLVPVVYPTTRSDHQWKVKPHQYPIPGGIIAAGFRSNAKIAIQELLPKLSSKNYSKFYQVLLWVEEKQMRHELAFYDMKDVFIIPHYPEYEIEVPGLIEGRPLVTVGDIIHVHHTIDTAGTWYEGYVHRVIGRTVRLRFNGTFFAHLGAKVDIMFTYNRLADRRMHQAVTSAFNPRRLLFPGSLPRKQPAEKQMRTLPYLVDRRMSNSPELLRAIITIACQPPGSVPFVISGASGTGKTAALIESAHQILNNRPDAKVLMCAPSNFAADALAKLLATHLDTGELFRLNSHARPFEAFRQQSATLEPYTHSNDGVFALPALATLEAYRVVVATCISAGILHGLGCRRGHFSHILIDDAGQATEPMAMVPIKTLADDHTNVVLAGDRRQLGPIVRSPVARDLGLQLSYLERLMNLAIYDENVGQGRTVVQLVKNFRSHPDILEYPNRTFYRGELQAHGDPVITHSLLNYDGLPRKGFPVVFHGVVGRDTREASSPSFFNIDEVSLVKHYALDILDNRKLRITVNDIGIIAPYHTQCQKILTALPERAKGIKVGSVEEFQGQERRVIIISTVRSSTDYLAYDMRHTLGFVADPKRFNVAITRAQSLLVVVGNPQTLALDPTWRGWLDFVREKGGCWGRALDWEVDEADVPTGGYVAQRRMCAEWNRQLRVRAEAEAKEMIERVRAQWLPRLELFAEDGEEADVDPREWPGREAD